MRDFSIVVANFESSGEVVKQPLGSISSSAWNLIDSIISQNPSDFPLLRKVDPHGVCLISLNRELESLIRETEGIPSDNSESLDALSLIRSAAKLAIIESLSVVFLGGKSTHGL